MVNGASDWPLAVVSMQTIDPRLLYTGGQPSDGYGTKNLITPPPPIPPSLVVNAPWRGVSLNVRENLFDGARDDAPILGRPPPLEALHRKRLSRTLCMCYRRQQHDINKDAVPTSSTSWHHK